MLFELEFSGGKPDGAFFSRFWEPLDEPEDVKRYAELLAKGAWKNLGQIDSVLRECAENWVLERMAAVDRNILRAAAFELLHSKDVPAAVAINEAIEIAKKFSMKESAAFINGILDRVAKMKVKG